MTADATSTAVRELPTVSVVIPAFNEEMFMGACVESLLAQDYPADRMEIIVADGRSTDRTRDILTSFAAKDARVRWIDNPRRVKQVGFNRGVQAATGELIIWASAHATYPENYVRSNVRALLDLGADGVGGRVDIVSRATSVVGRAIALCAASRFGLGVASYRRAVSSAHETNAVFGGCYRKALFSDVGPVDERLDRGQDREWFQRLRRRGRRVMYAPSIHCTYYQRSDAARYFPWLFACGMTPFFISRITGTRNWVLRNLAPPAFVIGLVLLPAIATWWPPAAYMWIAMMVAYAALAFLATAVAVRQTTDVRVLIALLFLFPLSHATYGLGALYGLVRPVRVGEAWATQ